MRSAYGVGQIIISLLSLGVRAATEGGPYPTVGAAHRGGPSLATGKCGYPFFCLTHYGVLTLFGLSSGA